MVERESTQRAAAREEPGVREHESAQRAAARATRTFDMACKYVDGKYIFHQTCGLWNAPCVHGCGTFTYLPQHSDQGKNVAQMAACHLLVRTLTRN